MRTMRGVSVWTLLAAACVYLDIARSEADSCQKCDSSNFCNCSSMNLVTIPRVLEKVSRLNLSYNFITHIKETDLTKHIKLKVLMLQSNEIQSIDDQAFKSNVVLEYLDLSNNSLIQLSPAWFLHLSKLQHLDLSGNKYRNLGPGRLFSHLESLRWLKVGNAFLSNLKKDDFEGISHLDDFILLGNKLESYEDRSFSSFQNVSHATMNLHDPFQKKQSLVQRIIWDLAPATTHVELRDLEYLSSSDTQLFSLPNNSSVKKYTFRNSSLSDNTIYVLLKNIRDSGISELVAENCAFSGRGEWHKVKDMTCESLISLTIRHISIKQFYLFFDLSFLHGLISHVRTARLTNLNLFMMPCGISQHFQRLEYLDLRENLLTDLMMKEMVCENSWSSLMYLILRKNKLHSLKKISPILSNITHLTHLDLSQNTLSDVDSCVWSKTLQFLNLSGSQLSTISQCIPPNIEVLDLSNNNIRTFTTHLPSLRELNVSNNKLMYLPGGGYLPNVKILMISGNNLISMSSDEITTFDKLTTLDAGKNHYICSCEFLTYINKYLTHSIQLLNWPENYICDSPLVVKRMIVKNTKRSFFDCHTTLSVTLSCVALCLPIAIVGLLCYKYHGIWYIQMTWAWLQAKRKPKKVRNNNIFYDAFVSYSEMDSEWVENVLLRELENTHPPVTLCLHKRDFIPGKWIIDNIIESIEKSRKTLFVLSQHFVQSEWCKYELDYSHFRLFDENNDTAILVLLEPIPKETIPQRFCKLRKLMNTKTYLEWPEDEVEQKIFWFNLKVALKGEENIGCQQD
ncbi:toll-like receptor 2 [Callorhinchus milii]|uniref:toll-like receptor 2 n=1 Tax=Callorhinchus milii TaxID=7868 RepID=UPI001C3F52CA|nr:toll-like receptor 2 [Callorhinchus milii]